MNNETTILNAAKPQQPNFKSATMGFGNVSIGTCVSEDTGYGGIIYLDGEDARPIDTDTSDLFPVGERAPADKILALIYFATADSVRQSIRVLSELLTTHFKEPPQAQNRPKASRMTEEELDSFVAFVGRDPSGGAVVREIVRAVEAYYGIPK